MLKYNKKLNTRTFAQANANAYANGSDEYVEQPYQQNINNNYRATGCADRLMAPESTINRCLLKEVGINNCLYNALVSTATPDNLIGMEIIKSLNIRVNTDLPKELVMINGMSYESDQWCAFGFDVDGKRHVELFYVVDCPLIYPIVLGVQFARKIKL